MNTTRRQFLKLAIATAAVALIPSLGSTSAVEYDPYFNVKNFGAVGDGVTDDTAAFNRCVRECGVAYAPPGNYLILGELDLTSFALREPAVTSTAHQTGLK